MRKAVFLLGAAVLAHEVCLLRALHVAWFGHAAALVVSVALLGFGVAGTLLALVPRLCRPSVAAACAALYAIAIPLSLLLATRIDFNVLQVGWEPKEWRHLLALQGVFLVPWTLAALALWIALAADPRRAGGVYGANLLGSGVGALLAAPLLDLGFPPEVALGGLALLAALAALAVPGRPAKAWALVGFAGVFALGAPRLRMSPYKDLAAAPDKTWVSTVHGPRGRVDRVRIPSLHFAPGLSMMATQRLPPQEGLFVDGHLVGAVDLDGQGAYLDETVEALPFVLGRPTRVARLGVGSALSRAHWVVEANADLLRASGARGEVATPRAWLRSARGFDLVFTSVQDSDPLRVDPLLTVEGLAAALRSVGPDGQVLVSTRITTPPRPGLRLLAMADRVCEHVVAVRSLGRLAVVLRGRQASDEAMGRLGSWAEAMGFDIVRPVSARPERPFHETDTPFLAPGSEYPFDVAPVWDARPYFHRFFRWERLGDVGECRATAQIEWAFLAHLVAFLQILALALALLLAPLASSRRARAPAPLFLALGFAFMLVEMAWLARATVHLGSPSLAAASVLGGFLVGSGLGSLAGERLGRPLRRAAIAAAVLPLVSWFWMPTSFLGILLVAAVAAFPMGMPFPAALARLPRPSVAWAMAVNGFASVAAAAGSPLLASSTSIRLPLLVGAGLYVLVACMRRGHDPG